MQNNAQELEMKPEIQNRMQLNRIGQFTDSSEDLQLNRKIKKRRKCTPGIEN